MRRLLLIGLTVLALAGCGAQAPAAEAPAQPAPAAGPTPITLSYRAVGVEGAPLEPTGLDGKGALEVPPVSEPQRVVWLRWSQRLAPGRPLVAAAHVSGRDAQGRAVPGAFSRLGEAIPGDEVTVRDSTGDLTRYTVRDVQKVDKDRFPTEQVYGPRPGRWLVAVTCGGTLDRAAHSYEDNILVFAEATA